MKTNDWSSNAGRALLLMLFALPMLSGCTVLGFGVGSLIDDGNATIEEVPLSIGLLELEAGDRVTCVRNDGSAFAGEYAGLGVPTKSTLQQLLPSEAPGDCAQRESVRLGDELVMKREGREAETVVYASADRERLFYRPKHGDAVQALLFMHIEQLTRCGGKSVPRPYSQQVDKGLFERVVQLRLLTEGGLVDVDTSTIRSLRFERTPSTAKVAFGIAGLAGDVVMIATISLGNRISDTFERLTKK